MIHNKKSNQQYKMETSPFPNLERVPSRINFYDKKKRGVFLNTNEQSDLNAVCKMGCEQVFKCYQHLDKEFSLLDIVLACEQCHFALTFTPKIHKDYMDYLLAYPYFITDQFYNYLDDNKGKSYVYFISDGHYVKIGVANSINRRLGELQTGNPNKLTVISAIRCKNEKSAFALENNLHTIFSDFAVIGEWFDILNVINVEHYSTIFPYEE